MNHAHVRQVLPFPTEEMFEQMKRAKKVVVVENNMTGQLAALLKLYVGMAEKVVQIGKYDGNPFLPAEVYNQCKELMVHGHV